MPSIVFQDSVTFKSFQAPVSEIRVGEAIWNCYVRVLLHNQILFQNSRKLCLKGLTESTV